MANTITIGGRELEIRYTTRAVFLFEEIAEKNFEVKSSIDTYLFYYCIVMANNRDCGLDFEGFVDALDEDPALLGRINAYIGEQQKFDSLFSGGDKEGDKKKAE